jgi:cyanophycinase
VVLVPYAGVSFDKPETEEEGPPGSQTFNDAYSKLWREAGAQYVTVVNLNDPESAIAAVKEADYIFFGGGDQVELLRWIDRQPRVMEAIRERHRQGALVGGMSAGAAAMPRLMIAGGDTADLKSIRSGGTLISPGLGFWPEIITDQHFVKRQRFARLVSAVLDHPKTPGVAIDEATTILVSDREFEVFGLGNVIVFDARRAAIKPAAKGENQSATNVRMSVLRAGDHYRWR